MYHSSPQSAPSSPTVVPPTHLLDPTSIQLEEEGDTSDNYTYNNEHDYNSNSNSHTLPPHHNKNSSTLDMETRSNHLESLRQALRVAKIPLSTSTATHTNELPLQAMDCVLVAGTSRCSLPLCEDSCDMAHHHHRTHARPTNRTPGSLIYQRPSISIAAAGNQNGLLSQFVSPADSPINSSTSSPTGTGAGMNSRRQSLGFGFSIGFPTNHHRGSLTSVNGLPIRSGLTTPALDYLASSPPSPLSDSRFTSGVHSNSTSAPQSPRERAAPHATRQQQQQVIQPSTHSELLPSATFQQQQSLAATSSIQEETLPLNHTASSTSSSSTAASAASVVHPHPSSIDYWRIRHNHLINVNDYRPNQVGFNTVESLSRRDLESCARDDFVDQMHPSFDPRSPQPPSPIQQLQAQVVRIYMSEDQNDYSKPAIEYELAVQ